MEPKLIALESQFVRDVDAFAVQAREKHVVLLPQQAPAKQDHGKSPAKQPPKPTPGARRN